MQNDVDPQVGADLALFDLLQTVDCLIEKSAGTDAHCLDPAQIHNAAVRLKTIAHRLKQRTA